MLLIGGNKERALLVTLPLSVQITTDAYLPSSP